MLTRRQPTLPGPLSAGALGGSSLQDPFGRVGASKWGSLEEAGGDCGCGSGTKPGFGRSPDRDVPSGCGCAETRKSPSAGVNCRPDTRSLDALDAAAERTGAAFAGLDRVTPGGQVGGPPPPPSVRGPTLPGTELVEPGQYLGETSRLVQDSGVGTSSRRLGPPPFKGLNIYTQLCFAKIYGQAEWPAHTCQGPRINPTDSCDLTPSAYASEIIGCMNNHGNSLDRGGEYDREGVRIEPTSQDKAYWNSAFGLLLDNFDLARWALCLVQAWSPEIKGLGLEEQVVELITPDHQGTIPLSVTFLKGEPGEGETLPDGTEEYGEATAWAFTYAKPSSCGQVGVIQAIRHTQWLGRLSSFERGGQAALCAATLLAAMILHEMVQLVKTPTMIGTSLPTP